jgi:hypothetical protein
MLNLSSDTIINDAFENPRVLKYLKVAGVVVVIVECFVGQALVGPVVAGVVDWLIVAAAIVIVVDGCLCCC